MAPFTRISHRGNTAPSAPTKPVLSSQYEFRRFSLRTENRELRTSLPGPAAANPTALRCESIVVPHDQLRLDLRDRVHRNSYHNQKRCPPKIKIHSQAVGYPGGKVFEDSPHQREVVQLDTRNHPLR